MNTREKEAAELGCIRSPSRLGRVFCCRSFWLVVGACVSCLMWIAWRASTIHERRAAIAALEAAGVVSADYDFPDPRSLGGDGATAVPHAWEWPGKAWLRARLGRDWTNDPVEVILTGSEFDDGQMAYVARLGTVQWLTVQHTTVTGAGVARLMKLPLQGLILPDSPIADDALEQLDCLKSLRELDLSDTKVTDAGLRHLAKLRSLQVLALSGDSVSDQGLEALAGMRSLKRLYLDYTNVTDAGLASLKAMHELEGLTLAETRVTGAGLAHLAEASKLKALDLFGAKLTADGLTRLGQLTSLRALMLGQASIDDAALAQLKSLVSLEHLDLNETAVTDAGLMYLKDMHSLEVLELYGTQITAAGFARLEAAVGRHIEGFCPPNGQEKKQRPKGGIAGKSGHQ